MSFTGDFLVEKEKSILSATETIANAATTPTTTTANKSKDKDIMQDSSWADGLRGIASLFVVSSHIVLCFARSIVLPCCGDDNVHARLFQRPIFRLVAQGHSWVALFFILSGFVNALKPIKLARAGHVENALTGLALSSFRRTFRLMLPAAAATILSWMVCQMGFYEYARNGDAYWLYTYTPAMSATWGTAWDDLLSGLKATWALGSINVYDQPQWALIYLLLGSTMIFCALLMTINLKPMWRTACLGVFAMWSLDWSYKIGDPLVGFTVFLGITLAEFHHSHIPERLASLSPFVSPPLIFVSLILMSYPSDYAHQAVWSNQITLLGNRIFPPQRELARMWGSVGGVLLLIGILISPHARRLLSPKPVLWLGKISFPVYLLHGTFMRSLMAWITFMGQTPKMFEMQNGEGQVVVIERYPQPGNVRIGTAVAISMACMLVAAHYWTMKVEPLFAKITKTAEEIMVGRGDGGAVGGGRPALPVRKE